MKTNICDCALKSHGLVKFYYRPRCLIGAIREWWRYRRFSD